MVLLFGFKIAPSPKSDIIVLIPGRLLYPVPLLLMIIDSIGPYASLPSVEYVNLPSAAT